MSDMKAAVIYCRVASKDEIIILEQEENLRRYACEKGLNITAVYSDNGVSGVVLNRPALNAMMTDIERGKVDSVIVKDISRIGRNFIQVNEWLDHMKNKCVRVIGVADMFDNFNVDNTLLSELSKIIRQTYKETHSARVKSGIARKREQESTNLSTPHIS